MIDRTLLRALLPAIIALALLVAGCGDDEGNGEPQGTPTPTPEATPVLEGVSKELVDLLARGLDVTYKVTYQTTTPEGQEGDTYVVINKPPRARIDTIPVGQEQPNSLIIGGQGVAALSCSGGPNEWQCFELEGGDTSPIQTAGPVVFLRALDLTGLHVTETGSRLIADQATRCFELRADEDGFDAQAEYCLNSDGITFYTRSEVGTVEAIEVTTNVPDSAFEPPAEPQP